MGLIDFFLNKPADQAASDNQVVTTPAFSLTKVMAVVAPLVTVVTTYVTSQVKDMTFSTGQVTALIIVLILFLAVTSSADVLARGRATAATVSAQNQRQLVRFDKPIPAQRDVKGVIDPAVTVVAATVTDPQRFLCVSAKGEVTWESAADVLFKEAPA